MHAYSNTNLFKDMLTGNNAKNEDNFMDSGSIPLAWMNVKDIKRNQKYDQGRAESLDSFKLSHEQLKNDNNLSISLALL